MKKIALFIAVAIAAIACEKTPEIVPEIVCDTDNISLPVTISEDEDYYVSFSSTVEWTAKIMETNDWCVISPVSGAAGSARISIIAESNEDYDPRSVTLVITAGTAVKEIEIIQGQVDAFGLVETSAEVGQDGGSVEIKANTNVDWAVVIPSEATWVHLVESKAYGEQKKSLSVDPFTELDGQREAVLSVTVGGEEKATFTITQNGPSSTVWYKNVTSYAEYTSGTKVKLAKYGDKLAMLNGNKVLILNSSTGEYEQKIDLPQEMHSLCVDDAGNIIVANDANYGDEMIVYTVADIADPQPVKLLSYDTKSYYGVDAGNLRVKGDINKSAVITAVVSDGAGGAFLYWEVKDGVAGEWQWVNVPYAGSTVNGAVGVAAGTEVSDGFFYIGYSGDYNLKYLANPVKGSGNEWVISFVTGSSWMENYNCLSTATCNGKNYLAYVMGCHFNYDNTDVVLLDVTDPAAATKVYEKSCEMFVNRDGDWANLDWTGVGAFSDVLLTVDGDSLLIYYADANFNIIGCCKVLL